MKPTGAEQSRHRERGFSLIEMLIGMTVLLIAMGAASKLLSASFRTRTRENQRTEALADAQRALNIMSHDIANSGFGLLHGEPGSTIPDDNGIVPADSSLSSIRLRANIHNDTVSDPMLTPTEQELLTNDPDEDVSYVLQPSGALVRWDNNSASNCAVLANRITSLYFIYLDDNGAGNLPVGGGAPPVPTATQVAAATRVRIDLLVRLPATPDSPSSVVRLSSDVTLRNSGAELRRY